jgi:hypothetical protein
MMRTAICASKQHTLTGHLEDVQVAAKAVALQDIES